ncbi:MAG TPA: glycosyltransferase [Ignavibacteria bacterium]
MPRKINEISVLMPAFNSALYIGKSVRSILNQTFKDFEFIIVNDGSTDNTEEIILNIKDERIKYLKTENKGTAAALNFGISKAKFDWIARIDADDLSSPARLEKQVSFINENPDIDVLSTWSVYFKDKGKIIFLLKTPVEHKDILRVLNLHNPLNQSGVIYRKKLIKQEKYNEKFDLNEDFELFHRIREKAKFYIIPEFLTYTRISRSSKSFGRRNNNVYNFLFTPAFKNLIDAKSKGDHFYWATTIAWINFFYGDRKDSRSYFRKSFSMKNIAAYIATLLPDRIFNKLISYRLRYRFQSIFEGKKIYKKELQKLLS